MNTNANTSIKCVLCNGLCENEYGNNPFPLSETGMCCNVCNIKVVEERIQFVAKEWEVEYKILAFQINPLHPKESTEQNKHFLRFMTRESKFAMLAMLEKEAETHGTYCPICELDMKLENQLPSKCLVCVEGEEEREEQGTYCPNCDDQQDNLSPVFCRECDDEENQCESCGECGCQTAIADMYKSSIHLTEGICCICYEEERDEREAEEEERQFLRNKEAQGLVCNAIGQWLPKQDIYECNTCQEDFDRLDPIWNAMGIKDSNYCLPCELAHEQPIECERCKGMFAPDDICDDRCVPCYENYQEWLEENDMDA